MFNSISTPKGLYSAKTGVSQHVSLNEGEYIMYIAPAGPNHQISLTQITKKNSLITKILMYYQSVDSLFHAALWSSWSCRERFKYQIYSQSPITQFLPCLQDPILVTMHGKCMYSPFNAVHQKRILYTCHVPQSNERLVTSYHGYIKLHLGNQKSNSPNIQYLLVQLWYVNLSIQAETGSQQLWPKARQQIHVYTHPKSKMGGLGFSAWRLALMSYQQATDWAARGQYKHDKWSE